MNVGNAPTTHDLFAPCDPVLEQPIFNDICGHGEEQAQPKTFEQVWAEERPAHAWDHSNHSHIHARWWFERGQKSWKS